VAGLRRISYLWKDAAAARAYSTGVSLHSHTNQSKESLNFLAAFGSDHMLIRKVLAYGEKRAINIHKTKLNFSAGYWTPPLTPHLAFDLESRQIAEKLGLAPLVSISDHDNINAPMLLRTVPPARDIPVSVEWTVPYGPDQSFHLGIHNLSGDTGAAWMRTLEEFTAKPSDARLTEILAALHALPDVLIIFNHPLWDLYTIGKEKHGMLVHKFLEVNGEFIHALELNGLRSWEENREVKEMAKAQNRLLISGGDRHGVEPNANVNLTSATSFTDFVHEVRYEGLSHVLFMPQYNEPRKYRVLQTTLDAIRSYPDFPKGSRSWDERIFHPDSDGVIRPLCELWPYDGSVPRYIHYIVSMIKMLGSRPVSSSLRMVWSESGEFTSL
jgi:hypothetical protein